MPDILTLSAFALIALGMVLTPGPNMVYLISRSICQGPLAGLQTADKPVDIFSAGLSILGVRALVVLSRGCGAVQTG